jgi:hypothetical protein
MASPKKQDIGDTNMATPFDILHNQMKNCTQSFDLIKRIGKEHLIYLSRQNEEELRLKINVEKIGIKAGAFISSDTSSCMEIFLLSRVFGEGPKIYAPDQRTFEAFENIDINIGIEDYHQPFPTMIVELPPEYIKNSVVYCPQFDIGHSPILNIVHHNEKCGCITVGVVLELGKFGGFQMATKMIYPRPGENTIEEILKSIGAKIFEGSVEISEGEHYVSHKVTKASINALGILFEEGCKKVISKRKGWKHLTKHAVPEIKEYYEFKQEVRMYSHSSGEKTDIYTGRIRPPGWVKGHRRRQHHGPGGSLVKVITIKPYTVNFHLFKGDISETQWRMK